MQSIRERLRQQRRQRRLRMLRFFFCIVLLVCASVGLWRFVHRTDLAFGRTYIVGTSKLTQADVLKMAGCSEPFNFFNISFSRLRDGLAQDFRFQTSEVNYKFPVSVEIRVKEREPALYVANSYRSYLQIDYEGYVLDVSNGIADARVPLLVGAKCGNVFLGDKISDASVLVILKFLSGLTNEARDRIAEITLDDRNAVRFGMRNGFPILLGAAPELLDKQKIFSTVFEEIKNKNISAEFIDLTFSKPYIRLLPQEKNEAGK